MAKRILEVSAGASAAEVAQLVLKQEKQKRQRNPFRTVGELLANIKRGKP